VARAHLRGEQA
jgi:flagellar biosynthesis/type III secretory pathway protein FliH